MKVLITSFTGVALAMAFVTSLAEPNATTHAAARAHVARARPAEAAHVARARLAEAANAARARLAVAPNAAKAGDPVKGQKIFTLQKCSTCHPVNGKGIKLAPDLGAIGLKRDAEWLAKFLVNPTPLDPKNPPSVKMTPVKLKGQDLDDLIAYLLTLKTRK